MHHVHNFVQSEKMPFEDSVRAFLPHCSYIPLSQEKDSSYSCLVHKGETVCEGQVIAVAEDSRKKNSDIHSPIPGKVEDIFETPYPDGRKGQVVKISLSGSFSYLGKKKNGIDWKSFSPDYLESLFIQKGVDNTFSVPHSLASDISDSKKHKSSVLVVRCFDSDPSLMTDSFITEHYFDAVAEGSFIIAKALDAKVVVFAFSEGKEFSLDKYDFGKIEKKSCLVDTRFYPCGFKNDLIKAVKALATDKESISNSVNHKSLFIDSVTALAADDAVVYGKPAVERFVHVTGNCLRSAAMFCVRIGTTIGSLALQCGGFKSECGQIVINGLLSGFSVDSLDVPVSRNIKSVVFIPANEMHRERTAPCIRCGQCRSVCPQGLFPDLVYRNETGGKHSGLQLLEFSRLCSDCGLCNSVCASRLPLAQTMKLLRKKYEDKI